MTYLSPQEFSPGGQSQNPDVITYERDDSGPPLNWRLATPPFAEDGSTPNVATTVTDSPNPLPVQTGTVPSGIVTVP